MDPLTISVITGLCLSAVTLIGKLLSVMRKNLKSCLGFNFRSPTPSPTTSPRNSELEERKKTLTELHKIATSLEHIVPQHEETNKSVVMLI